MTNIEFKINQTIHNLIAECHSDDVGLWLIIGFLKDDGVKPDSQEMRRLTMHVVNALLDEPEIVAMNYLAPNYHIWNFSRDEINARIEREWNEMDRDPSLAHRQIVFFVSKQIAKKYIDQNK